MTMIGCRLLDVINMVKPGTILPIIIEFGKPPTAVDIQEVTGTGTRVSEVSKLAPIAYGMATSAMITKLSENPGIKMISYDEPVTIAKLPNILSVDDVKKVTHIPVNMVAESIHADSAHENGYTGKGVKIAVIDTGVDESHPMISDALHKSVSLVDNQYTDGNGHGTHVSSIALGRSSASPMFDEPLQGIAHEASLISIKVLSDNGSGKMSDIIKGMERAVELGAHIINMSLGTNFDNAGVSPDAIMADTISREYNIPCVIAAGNSFMNGTIGSPGSARQAITIGSVAMYKPIPDIVSTFSSKGPTSDFRIKPTFASYGGNILPDYKELIYSATAGGMASAAGSRYTGLMGTSMACPSAAGAIALLLQAGAKRDTDYIRNLVAYTTKTRYPQNVFSGYGVINVQNAIEHLDEFIPPVAVISTIMNSVIGVPFLPMTKFSEKLRFQQATAVRLPYLT
jgi:subtilisin family serine protease